MRKWFLFVVIFALVFMVWGCTKKVETSTPVKEDTKAVSTDKVCCESYGYGAEMKKCCEKYEWTKQSECSVAEGFVGGGKNVVDNAKCQ